MTGLPLIRKPTPGTHHPLQSRPQSFLRSIIPGKASQINAEDPNLTELQWKNHLKVPSCYTTEEGIPQPYCLPMGKE